MYVFMKTNDRNNSQKLKRKSYLFNLCNYLVFSIHAATQSKQVYNIDKHHLNYRIKLS